MPKLERSALVSFSAAQMYALVNEIEEYPHFMPGCIGAEIIDLGPDWLEARLDLRKSGFEHSFITRNLLQPPGRIDMALVDGPFRYFQGCWIFQALSAEACKVQLQLEFELKSKLLGAAAAKLFEHVANQQVDAICQRAQQVYR